jgi:hypothetical protein
MTPGPTADVELGGNAYLTIDVLPDDVLLDIFDFCKLASLGPSWGWFKLVHVCRRWRSLVFASRHRLDLRLFCTYGTPVRKILDCWPPLPIIVQYDDPAGLRPPSTGEDDNIIAALQHSDRVCAVGLTVGSALFPKLSPLMQRPLPSLECLTLRPRNNERLVLPGTFLGGCAPRLRNLHLDAVASPALPAFLPSCRNLVRLQLQRIPGDGWASPDALVACLSTMAQLRTLRIQFATRTSSSSSPPAPGTSPSPATAGGREGRQRVALPALSHFEFRGTSEFLEDFVARIDSAPSLARTCISFFDHERQHHHPFEIPRLAQFMGRADAQQQQQQQRRPVQGGAQLMLRNDGISISLSRPRAESALVQSQSQGPGRPGLPSSPPRGIEPEPESELGTEPGKTGTMTEWLRLHVSCAQLGRQVSLMSQICHQITPLLSRARRLDILTSAAPRVPQDVADAAEWLGLLYTFGGVERLYVTYGSVPDVARALQRVSGSGERPPPGAAEVLPALRELHFDWFAARWEEAVASFITARQLSGHHPPIAFHQPKRVLA